MSETFQFPKYWWDISNHEDKALSTRIAQIDELKTKNYNLANIKSKIMQDP